MYVIVLNKTNPITFHGKMKGIKSRLEEPIASVDRHQQIQYINYDEKSTNETAIRHYKDDKNQCSSENWRYQTEYLEFHKVPQHCLVVILQEMKKRR